MYVLHPRLERLREFQRLSTWDKKVLLDWIEANVDDMSLWSYTSIGITELFEQSQFGYTLSHGQMQHALLQSGFLPLDENAEVWVFVTGSTSQ